jgi:long-subunit fatty acid transport protein
MDQSAWLGLGIGVIIGGAYAALQVRSLKQNWVGQQQGQPPQMGRQMLASMVRVLTFAAAVLAVLQFTKADRWWFGGSLAVAYSVPFFWRLKIIASQKK